MLEAKQRQVMAIAYSPGKNLLSTAFMLWMSGENLRMLFIHAKIIFMMSKPASSVIILAARIYSISVYNTFNNDYNASKNRIK